MIQIYPVPGSDNKRWFVEIDIHDLPSKWGYEKKEFDSWDKVISYVNKCHRREQRLRFKKMILKTFSITGSH